MRPPTSRSERAESTRLKPHVSEAEALSRSRNLNGSRSTPSPWPHKSIMPDDKRLIEDYLPIVAICAEAAGEIGPKGHISTLHLWWARGHWWLARAAVYGALVPASRFVPNAGSDEKKKSLGRANAAKFVERLCKYPGNPEVIAEAQGHKLEAHAERLHEEDRRERSRLKTSSRAVRQTEGAGYVCGGRSDSSGSTPTGLRRLGARPQSRRAHHPTLHTGLSPEIRQTRLDRRPRYDRPEERQGRNHLGRTRRRGPLLGRVGLNKVKSEIRKNSIR